MRPTATDTATETATEIVRSAFQTADQAAAVQALTERLSVRTPWLWRQVAAALVLADARNVGPGARIDPRIIAVSGSQGSGKSTLARALVDAYEYFGFRAARVSLDDFYLGRRARTALAEQVHPLLQTRGVPGTHDTRACAGVLAAVRASDPVALPRFDKSTDNPYPKEVWDPAVAPDRLVFEGWCIGARPVPDHELSRPFNALEAGEDPQGHYRRYWNRCLAGYVALWAQCDVWLFLAAPGMDVVERWRTQQEQELPSGRRMDAAALRRFVAHYARLTDWMLRDAPARATWTLRLDGERRIVDARSNIG